MLINKKNIRAVTLALLVTQAAPLSAISASWYKNPWVLTSIGSAATSLAFFAKAGSLYNSKSGLINGKLAKPQSRQINRTWATAYASAGAAFLVLAGFCLSRVK